MKKKKLIEIFSLFGVIGVLFYFLHVILGTHFYEGYNSMAQAISDLTASNSPSRNIARIFSMIYGIFTVSFSICFFVYLKQKINRWVTFGAGFFCIMTIVSFFGYTFFPLSESGYSGTFQDIMHMAVTVAVVLLTVVSLILFMIGFFGTQNMKYLGIVSLCTFLLLLTGAMLLNIFPKELFGIAERINVYSIVIYTGILSFWMYKYINTPCTSYSRIINESYQRLEAYNIKTFDTEYGTMSYVDEGFGEAIIISHGIFGGYDQGYTNLYGIFGTHYRKIVVSRFGYPGSNLPQEPVPGKQARVFLKLIDELQIDKVFLIAASAGGAAGIRFALDYPDRLKGLILLSSGVPSIPMAKKELGMSGPPKFILNDRLMLFFIRNFKGIFYSMFGSKNVPDEIFDNMLPVKPRKNGIINDTEIINVDMAVNFNDYPVENLNIPILVITAKDDPMVKYADTEHFLKRVNAELMIFPDGGHLIIGHDITEGVISFIEKNSF